MIDPDQRLDRLLALKRREGSAEDKEAFVEHPCANLQRTFQILLSQTPTATIHLQHDTADSSGLCTIPLWTKSNTKDSNRVAKLTLSFEKVYQ